MAHASLVCFLQFCILKQLGKLSLNLNLLILDLTCTSQPCTSFGFIHITYWSQFNQNLARSLSGRHMGQFTLLVRSRISYSFTQLGFVSACFSNLLDFLINTPMVVGAGGSGGWRKEGMEVGHGEICQGEEKAAEQQPDGAVPGLHPANTLAPTPTSWISLLTPHCCLIHALPLHVYGCI